ncbi:MAG: exosortase/archaeosortase family protein, partial [Planctomycetota bacterium]
PLPSLVEHSLLRVLQKLAAIASTTVLQVMGLPIYRIGSQMVIEGLATPLQLEVAEACSGLRMSTIFIAMTIAMVFLIQRPWWDKFTILLSAIPVALLVNVMRIVATALLYYAFPENKDLQKLIHDYAGLAMMPVAMGILWLELTILSNLTVEDDGIDYQSAAGGVMPRL